MRTGFVTIAIAMALSAANVGLVQAREISFWGHDFEVNDGPASPEFRQAAPLQFKAEVDHADRRSSRRQRTTEFDGR